ncbi:hypothetical protein Cgig2_025315 [Carnegiea gigantea]|uniref:Uncharacterized protein n=1 Tax=Carnegiea gigantea TaxID=171969 RepID=A0A9Q1QAT6_9CARY|nr:hypothetical protein Cgig2_025315 [Carnegiea gigantea]
MKKTDFRKVVQVAQLNIMARKGNPISVGFSLGGRALSGTLRLLGCSAGLALTVGFALRCLLTGEDWGAHMNMMLPGGEGTSSSAEGSVQPPAPALESLHSEDPFSYTPLIPDETRWQELNDRLGINSIARPIDLEVVYNNLNHTSLGWAYFHPARSRMRRKLHKGNIACHKSEASKKHLPYCERGASRAGLDEMRPFDEAKSISGHQTLQLMRRPYGVRVSVYVVTLPAFLLCLEDGPDAAERRPRSGFPTGRGTGDGHLKAHHDLQATPARPGKATRLGMFYGFISTRTIDSLHQHIIEHVLCNRGEGDVGPRKYQSCTFVPTGQEMGAVRRNKHIYGAKSDDIQLSSHSDSTTKHVKTSRMWARSKFTVT